MQTIGYQVYMVSQAVFAPPFSNWTMKLPVSHEHWIWTNPHVLQIQPLCQRGHCRLWIKHKIVRTRTAVQYSTYCAGDSRKESRGLMFLMLIVVLPNCDGPRSTLSPRPLLATIINNLVDEEYRTRQHVTVTCPPPPIPSLWSDSRIRWRSPPAPRPFRGMGLREAQKLSQVATRGIVWESHRFKLLIGHEQQHRDSKRLHKGVAFAIHVMADRRKEWYSQASGN